MFTLLRNNRKSITGLLLAGFVAILMLGFGANLNRTMNNRSNLADTAIKVADKKVTFEEFYQKLNNLSEMARYQLGENFAKMKPFLNLEQRTIDQIINDSLLKDYVNDLGLSASNAQVEQYLQNHPFFKKFGFNQQTYKNYLNSSGISAIAFEAETRQVLANKQLLNFLTAANTPTDKELEAIYKAKNTSYEFSYVSFKASKFENAVDKNDGALNAFFENNKVNYEQPRTVSYSYIKFNPESFEAKVEINEEELKSMYQENLTSYFEPKEFNLKKIVLNKSKEESNALENLVSPDTAKDSKDNSEKKNDFVKEAAKKIVERLKNNEMFETLAKELSQDKESAKNSGNLGWLKANSLDKDIRAVAERMEKGKFSDVIETADAYVIIYLEDIKDKRLKPFEEVRASIEKQRRQEDAPEYAKAEADAFLRKYQEQDSANKLPFEDFAKKENLNVEKTGKLMNASENPADAFGLTAKLITLSEGSAQVEKTSAGLFVSEVTQSKNSYIPELTEVKDEVVKDFIKQKSLDLAKQAAEKFLEKASSKEAKQFEQLAKETSLEIKNTSAAKKEELPENEVLFSSKDIVKTAFSLTTENSFPKTVAKGNGEYIVYKLRNLIVPNAEEAKSKLQEVLKSESDRAGTRVLENLLHVLKLESDTWVNPKILEESQQGTNFEI